MKRDISVARSEVKGALVICPLLMGWAPTVCEWLTASHYDDGELRETSTLGLFVDCGVLKLCLNDRDQFRTLYVTSDSLEGALLALEAALRGSTPDWRPWKGKRPKK